MGVSRDVTGILELLNFERCHGVRESPLFVLGNQISNIRWKKALVRL